MKIAVNAISKNEEMFVERFCASAIDADLILIADTGSTDDTVALARKQPKTIVYDICITPWRFDLARNAALALLPRDVDIVISLDLDEVLQPGWRKEIERVWQKDTTRLRYKFDWGSGISFYYEKIFARHGYRFYHPVHEYPLPDGRITEVYAHTDKLLVSHHPDPTKSRGQYLDLLKLAVTEDPHCPRNAFYYARELTFHQKWGESVVALLKYLDNPGATWPNERCYAMRLLGKAYETLGVDDQAREWYKKACAEAPNTREPWHDYAQFLYKRKEWQECLAVVQSGIAITDRQAVYTCDPRVWEEPLYDLGSIAAWYINNQKLALAYCETAVKMAPNDKRLTANLSMMRFATESPEPVNA